MSTRHPLPEFREDGTPNWEDSVDMSDAVTIAFVHSRNVEASWHHCKTELLGYDLASSGRVARGGFIAMTAETDGLAAARNKVVKEFLEKKTAQWLYWTDTDMGFSPDHIDRLLEDADPDERPIVGGLAFTWRQERSDGMGGWEHIATPTIFDWGVGEGDQEGQEGFIVRWDYHHDALQQCSGTGSACVLIHRSVFEKIEAKFGPDKWYSRIHNPKMNRLISEDLSFCLRAEVVGCTVWVDSSVKTTHAKTIYVSENTYFGQRALAAIEPKVPPATEPTAVIVPVLGRPQNAAPFMESFKASGADLAKVYAVVDYTLDEAPTADAWRNVGAQVILVGNEEVSPGTFAEKVNEAYSATDEPWLFLVGDDVRFHPRWLDHAQHVARDGAHVIGTNDLKNPRVIKGEHATHLLIRRNYIDERGASWDGPKVVCHEGYRHNFVDDEVVITAKQRDVWAFARHSKVEHIHPAWGEAEIDATYQLGQDNYERDQELFEQRFAAHNGLSNAR